MNKVEEKEARRIQERVHRESLERGEGLRIWCRERRLIALADAHYLGKVIAAESNVFVRENMLEQKAKASTAVAEMDRMIRNSYAEHSFAHQRLLAVEATKSQENAYNYTKVVATFILQQQN